LEGDCFNTKVKVIEDGIYIYHLLIVIMPFLTVTFQVKLPRYTSKHFEMKRELRRVDDRAFFLDIVKDIANDLDLKSLTKKITENLAILLDAEAASLFIVQGPRGKQTLVSKVCPYFPKTTNSIKYYLFAFRVKESLINSKEQCSRSLHIVEFVPNVVTLSDSRLAFAFFSVLLSYYNLVG
jgi:hypothetical protein